MSSSEQEFEAATRNADYLAGRLDSNKRFAQRDLNEWILSFVRVAEGQRILDVCCGTGKQLLEYARLAGRSGEVHGFDASPEALEQVSRSVPEDANVTLHQGYLEDVGQRLREFEGYFDWITCSYGLYYSKDARQTTRELTRLLTAGGRLAIIGPARNNNETFYSLVRRVAKIPDFVVYSSTVFMDDTLIPECRQLFATVDVHEFDNEIVYPDVEQVVAYWRSCGTYFDESALPEFRRLLNEHFVRQPEFRVLKQALGVVCNGRR